MVMPAPPTPKDRALAVVREKGIARARDFDAVGIPRGYLQRMQNEGSCSSRSGPLPACRCRYLSGTQPRRGCPRRPARMSALQFHELTTQTRHQVWILIGWKKWAPKKSPVSLRIIRATGESLTAGVEYHTIEQVPVPITVPAKTVGA